MNDANTTHSMTHMVCSGLEGCHWLLRLLGVKNEPPFRSPPGPTGRCGCWPPPPAAGPPGATPESRPVSYGPGAGGRNLPPSPAPRRHRCGHQPPSAAAPTRRHRCGHQPPPRGPCPWLAGPADPRRRYAPGGGQLMLPRLSAIATDRVCRDVPYASAWSARRIAGARRPRRDPGSSPSGVV